MRCPAFVRKEAWVLAPPEGWHYYEVLPGGIRRVRQEQEQKGPGPGEETPFRDARVPQPVTARGEAG